MTQVQQDVTPQQEAQRQLVGLLEAEHQLLENVSDNGGAVHYRSGCTCRTFGKACLTTRVS